MRGIVLLLLAAACAGPPERDLDLLLKAKGGQPALAGVETALIVSTGRFGPVEYTSTQHYRRKPLAWRWTMESAMGVHTMWASGQEGAVNNAYLGRSTSERGHLRLAGLQHARVSVAALLPDLLLQGRVDFELGDREDINQVEHRKLRIYFEHDPSPVFFVLDKKTRLIREIRFRAWDAEALRFVPVKAALSDYREVQGILVAHRWKMNWDNRMLLDETVKEVRFNRAPPKGCFDPPPLTPERPIVIRNEPEQRCAVQTFAGPPNEAGAALGRLMAFIGARGGQPAGPTAMLYRKPTSYIDVASNEVILQVPVRMSPAPAQDGVSIGMRPAFKFAHVRYEGPPHGAVREWSRIYDWCVANGYLRSGPRRLVVMRTDEKTGNVVGEVGFPVKRKAAWR
ncbi:MAG: GyrI-like domain-containing protein [Planctomycetota bacterium]|jgi:effector-binding domain-containing protein